MKLFSDIKDEQKEENDHKSIEDSSIIVIASRTRVIDSIVSALSIYGINDPTCIKHDFSGLDKINIPQNTNIVVADITDITDVEDLRQYIDLLVPVNTRCIFVGDNDSILFSREVKKLGGSYLHLGSQLQELPEDVLDRTQITRQRGSMIVSVLGCKGGCGSTSFTYELIRAAGKISTIPLLMVQGALGSQDLDLVHGGAVPQDGSIMSLDKNISIKIEKNRPSLSYSDLDFNHFNIIFFDTPIYSCTPDQLESIARNSHSIMLIINRNLPSLRTAKRMIDYILRREVTSARSSRIFICVNDYRAMAKGDLTDNDIEEYLERKIDVVHPYQLSKGNNSEGISDSLSSFAAKIMGRKIEEVKKKSSLVNYLNSLSFARKEKGNR